MKTISLPDTDCPHCEDGRCPCGTGCVGCVETGQCPECHGLARTGDRLMPAARICKSAATRGRSWCPVCDRHTAGRERAPDYSGMRERNPGVYKRVVSMLRCIGCHTAFSGNPKEHPNSYRLQEDLCSTTSS